MTEQVQRGDIETVVGYMRHNTMHVGRAVSRERRVYILHSKECLETQPDLRKCEMSIALDAGIRLEDWKGYEDKPVALGIIHDRLVPLIDLEVY